MKTVIESKDDVESISYGKLSSRGSQWQVAGFNEKRLIRTIDWKVLPFLFAAYFLQFMDKVILNYANVMGIQHDLGMKGDDFSWAGTAFFLGYGLAEFPQGLLTRVSSLRLQAYDREGALLQRFTVTKVLAINVCCWGIVTACTAAVQTNTQLLALRTTLGVFESVVTPSLIMITSAWYKRQEGAPRFGIWFCGLGMGQIIGGLVSFGAQHSASHLQGWRVMFLVIGLLNILISGFIFRLPPDPEKSTFLTPAEIEFIVQRLKDDHAGVGPKVVRKRSVIEAFLDLQTWLLCLITLLTTMSAGVVVYYSAILITTFGYNAKEAALLNMPSGVVAIVSTLWVVTVVRNGYPRWLTIAIACVPPTIGACLMSFLPVTSKVGLLIGIYLVNTVSNSIVVVDGC